MIGSSSGFETLIIAIVIVFMAGMAAGRATAGVDMTQRVKCVSHSVETGACIRYEIEGDKDGK